MQFHLMLWRRNPVEKEALIWTPKRATVRLQAILHGRWGVAQGCNCRSILETIVTLIEAQRPELALVLIEEDLKVRS
jgi:hypothetical protein